MSLASPQVAIVSPGDGWTVRAGEPLQLEGTAADSEDGPGGSPYAWTSSLDGALGSGVELMVRLSPGEHRLALSVADSEGSSGTDQITVHVIRDRWDLYLPLVQHTHRQGNAFPETFLSTADEQIETDLRLTQSRWGIHGSYKNDFAANEKVC